MVETCTSRSRAVPGGVNKLDRAQASVAGARFGAGAPLACSSTRLASRRSSNHPNVVQTYEVGTEGDRHVIVMEYLEGQSLAEIVPRRGKAGQTAAALAMYLRIVIRALEGLRYAHELARIRRRAAPCSCIATCSPQNIFVTYRGAVKVLGLRHREGVVCRRRTPRPAS